ERGVIIKIECDIVKSCRKEVFSPQKGPKSRGLDTEEALDGGEDSGGGVGAGGGVVCLGSEALATFRHDETEGFNQVRVRIEHPLHRAVADFEDLSLFECQDVCRPGLAGKQGHFAEEIALV